MTAKARPPRGHKTESVPVAYGAGRTLAGIDYLVLGMTLQPRQGVGAGCGNLVAVGQYLVYGGLHQLSCDALTTQRGVNEGVIDSGNAVFYGKGHFGYGYAMLI